jgi:Flp pilus assembly protein TadB
MKILSLLLCAVLLLLASTVRADYAAFTDYKQQEQRITDLERKVSEFQHKSPTTNGVDMSGVAMLFGAFCALWAQNTGRSAWLWFFLGLFFSAITVIVLLVKNSNDLDRQRQAERFPQFRRPPPPPP